MTTHHRKTGNGHRPAPRGQCTKLPKVPARENIPSETPNATP